MNTNNNESFMYGGHNYFRRKARRIFKIIRQVTILSLTIGVVGILIGLKYQYTNLYLGSCGFSIFNTTILVILLCLKEEIELYIYRKLLDGWCV